MKIEHMKNKKVFECIVCQNYIEKAEEVDVELVKAPFKIADKLFGWITGNRILSSVLWAKSGHRD